MALISVGITKMLMGASVRERSERKIFFRPLPGGPEKVDRLVVTNSTKCFMLFIVICDKIISAASIPIPDTSCLHYLAYFLVNETQAFQTNCDTQKCSNL